MSNFNLTYAELKEKAGIRENDLSDSTIHRWIQFSLISRKKQFRGNLYSNESVEHLKLCIKLRSYGKNIHEMKLLMDSYPLKTLSEKVGKITPDELKRLLEKVEK